MKEFVLVFCLLLRLSLSLGKSCQADENVNDNYCDCQDGLDEPLTSACSHLSMPTFRCNSGIAILDVLIPTSRIGDGVCDCCDGSDEIGSPSGVVCPQNCDAQLSDLREATLNEYQNVKAGREAR